MTKFETDISAPWHMWIVGGLLLLNNGIGALDYVLTVIRFEPYLANVPEETLSYYYNVPLGVYAMWGIAISAGLISAVFLLMRRSAAIPIFAIGWVCTVIAAVYTVMNPAPGSGGNLILAAVIIIALLIFIYMRWLQRRGVLR